MSEKLFKLLIAHFEALESQLNDLDAATGDGDHGSTLVKGLRALKNSNEGSAMKAFRKAAGGASGSLFAQLIDAFDKVLNEGRALGEALSVASERIFILGQAKAGDKTMLDALIPAANAAMQHPDHASRAAYEAAKNGVEATRNMQAKRGRARYVEGAGVGHLDAGAVSVAHMLEVYDCYINGASKKVVR